MFVIVAISPFQIIYCFSFSKYIIFVIHLNIHYILTQTFIMHLDIYYILTQSKYYISRKVKATVDTTSSHSSRYSLIKTSVGRAMHDIF